MDELHSPHAMEVNVISLSFSPQTGSEEQSSNGASNQASCFDQQQEEPPPKARSYFYPISRSLVSFYYRRVHESWRKINGYHFGVMCCAWTSAFVLLMDLIATIWGTKKFRIQGGLGTIQDGSCSTTTRLGFWLHLIINGLSTLLLGASNYSMQCLSSPTRRDVDRAHRQIIWLDIGIPSVQNLRRIASSRIALWWLLAISTITLHLFYNSAVFASLCSRDYNVWVVPIDFPDGIPFSYYSESDFWPNTTKGQYQQLQRNAATLQQLDNRACLKDCLGSINSNR